jgi:hypothetical protein
MFRVTLGQFGCRNNARQRYSRPMRRSAAALRLSAERSNASMCRNPRKRRPFPAASPEPKLIKYHKLGWTRDRDSNLDGGRQRLALDRFSQADAEREVRLQRGAIGSPEPVRRTADDLKRINWRFEAGSLLPRRCPRAVREIRGLELCLLTL